MADGRTPPSTDERFLVTGALGCLGAWTIQRLVRSGAAVVALDLATDPRRLRLIATPDEVAAVTFVHADITDLGAVERAIGDHGISHVIHLAALQVPFCRADPPLGAAVNVLGTVNVFEAVRRRADHVRQLVYTSSVGMYDVSDVDPHTGRLEAGAAAHPTTHYGVYKQANEGTARVYWLDSGVTSIGLRPMTVYGPGRDQGLTSAPTKAILAAVLGRPFTIGFGARTLFQYAEDVARTLIIAARAPYQGAITVNLGGHLVDLHDFAAAITAEVPSAAGLIEVASTVLPFPEAISDEGLEETLGRVPVTSLADGIHATAEFFRELLERGKLVSREHGLEDEAAAGAGATFEGRRAGRATTA